MRKGKRELALYYFFDHTWLEKHFEEMARRGWGLERMGVCWHYQKIQPQDLHYAVAYFPDGNYYKPPSEGEKTFEEYCAAAGWNEAADENIPQRPGVEETIRLGAASRQSWGYL